MIIDFQVEPNVYAEYCRRCHAKDSLRPITIPTAKNKFSCITCRSKSDRMLIIDPALHWWLDDHKIYWHESAGVMIVNTKKQVLFYELTKFPYGFTMPAGHVDYGETAAQAVAREATEEVGIKLHQPILLAQTLINGDSCRRGSDDHQWSLFAETISEAMAEKIVVDEREGTRPVWVDFADITSLQLPAAMRYLFDNFSAEIIKFINQTVSRGSFDT